MVAAPANASSTPSGSEHVSATTFPARGHSSPGGVAKDSQSGCTRGAFGAIASSMLPTLGISSISRTASANACFAMVLVSATTAAIGSPSNLTNWLAKSGASMRTRPDRRSGMSAAVRTPRTPGNSATFERSRATIRPAGTGDRRRRA